MFNKKKLMQIYPVRGISSRGYNFVSFHAPLGKFNFYNNTISNYKCS